MIATRHSYTPVKKGMKIAGTRIIPLVIEKEKMEEAERKAGPATIMQLVPYQLKTAGLITTGNEVKKGIIKDTFSEVVIEKLKQYSIEVVEHTYPGDSDEAICRDIAMRREKQVDMILCTGGMSVDPDDRTPLAIRNTGADIVTYGAPVLPGAMFLVSYLDGVPVCGLPGCVMYAKRTIFDLLLPRLLADDAITAEDIARLGEGGLCLGCAECHWPNCGFGHC